MRLQKLLRLLPLGLLLSSSGAAQAQFTFATNSGTITITGYTGPGGAVAIPSFTNGYYVTAIGYAAFQNNSSLTSVSIPDTVTDLGDEVFYNCTGLTNVTIGSNVTKIGEATFRSCERLTSVNIPDSVTSIGEKAFLSCRSLASVSIGAGVTSIGGAAFNNCISLSTLTIPDNVTSLAEPPADVLLGYGGVFEFCGLNSVNIGSGIRTIPTYAFAFCRALTTITIPNSVACIEADAFRDCSGLTNVTIGAGVTNIGDVAFADTNSKYGNFNTIQFYFLGNAPTLGANVFFRDFNATVYYLLGTTGWGPTFGGLPAVLLNPPYIPIVTVQPQSQVTSIGGNAAFSAAVIGQQTLSYQWRFNGTNLAGARLSSLTISNVTQTNLGTYAVVVTNLFGSVTSSNADLSAYPYLVSPFTGLVTDWGFTNTLSVRAWGTGPLFYQWYRDGVAIPGATDSSLTLSRIQFTNAGLYSVVVSSALGSVTNPPAQVVVNPAGLALGFSPTLTITGVVGFSYIIQSTTNLADTNAWVTMTRFTLTQPVEMWVDTSVNAASPFYSRYYYRVLPGP